VLHDLKHLRKEIVERMMGEEVCGPRVVLLSPCLRGGVGGVKYCWTRCSSNFSFRKKFVIGLLIDNNTFFFKKMCDFKSLSGYTDGGGYENRNAYFLIIIKSTTMMSSCLLF
jgi:hypothetical protein